MSAAPRPAEGAQSARIEREARHELLILPYYGVFDDLKYRVDGGTVTLPGHLTRPTLKDDAERAVKRIGRSKAWWRTKWIEIWPKDGRNPCLACSRSLTTCG